MVRRSLSYQTHFRTLQQYLLQKPGATARWSISRLSQQDAGPSVGGHGAEVRRSNQDACAEPAVSSRRPQILHATDHLRASGCDVHQGAKGQCRTLRRPEKDGGSPCVIIQQERYRHHAASIEDARHGPRPANSLNKGRRRSSRAGSPLYRPPAKDDTLSRLP